MKHTVRFYRETTTRDLHEIEVEAESYEEAAERVRRWGHGSGCLTPDEELSETLVREGGVASSDFYDV